jgi:uracil-DNA glycosylase
MNVENYIEKSWAEMLSSEFQQPYFAGLNKFLSNEMENKQVYPPAHLIFNAFAHSPIEQIKVVILGQDPYHGVGQAHGLSFSVPNGIAQPPSLRNIFKELHTDLAILPPKHGNLTFWAKQGILLLNSTLTVRTSEAASHKDKGWEKFTDSVIQLVSNQRNNVVFLLWGNHAQAKQKLIDTHKHLILKAAHPSPLSAHNGFFGCKHFSQTNDYLTKHNISPINWDISTSSENIL